MLIRTHSTAGYDTLPIEAMQGLDIGSGATTTTAANSNANLTSNHIANGGQNNTNTLTSNHSNGHSIQAANSPYGVSVGGGGGVAAMDMDVGDIGGGELLDALPSPPHDNSQVAAWYDTDL